MRHGSGTLRGVQPTPTAPQADPAGYDPTALARLDLENELDLWARAVAVLPGGESGRDASVAWFVSGLPFPYFNQVLTIGDAIEPGSLEGAVATVRARQVPFLVRIRAGVDDAVVPRLLALGLLEDPDEAVPAMALSRSRPTSVPMPTRGPTAWRSGRSTGPARRPPAVVADGFGMPEELARQLFAAELDVPGIAAFTGWLDGRAVASAFGYTAGGTVGVYNVATVQDARRRGFGGALTRRAIADGVERGATVAILQTSRMGRRLYESLGFREIVVFRAFVRSGRAGAAQDLA
jgi:ribosomal protein S18 acetylase RimI-like enzyme